MNFQIFWLDLLAFLVKLFFAALLVIFHSAIWFLKENKLSYFDWSNDYEPLTGYRTEQAIDTPHYTAKIAK